MLKIGNEGEMNCLARLLKNFLTMLEQYNSMKKKYLVICQYLKLCIKIIFIEHVFTKIYFLSEICAYLNIL